MNAESEEKSQGSFSQGQPSRPRFRQKSGAATISLSRGRKKEWAFSDPGFTDFLLRLWTGGDEIEFITVGFFHDVDGIT